MGSEFPGLEVGTYDSCVTQQPLERSLEAVAALRDPTRLRLYRYIERQPAAVSRDEAARVVGVSRALAAFHLEKLVGVGLLRPEYRRLSGRTGRGAGRTSKLYTRSARQFELSLPRRHHDVLARLLAESITLSESSTPETEPAHAYGRAIGSRAHQRFRGRRSPARLLRCVEDVAETLGFDPYRDSSDAVRLRNCPFDPLSRIYTALVCSVAQSILTGVVEGLGADQLMVSREMSPERCCGIVSALDGTEEQPA
jgi:predicted ArsR family transcriptional regulator